jgi:hypothetical protein
MGARRDRWRTRLSSDRAENVFAGILLGPMLAATIACLVWLSPPIDWPVARGPLVGYVLCAVLAGAALAVPLARWRPRRLRGFRQGCRDLPWGVVAAAAAYSAVVLVFCAPTVAAFYVCEHGEGIVVRTSWTHTDPDSGAKRGVYTYDGETYDIVIGRDQWLAWQVAEEIPPTADNPYYTRTYRVPWPGSDTVCAAGGDSRFGDLDASGAMGLALGTALTASLGELFRRLGRARQRRLAGLHR